jgi:hypothetical protein
MNRPAKRLARRAGLSLQELQALFNRCKAKADLYEDMFDRLMAATHDERGNYSATLHLTRAWQCMGSVKAVAETMGMSLEETLYAAQESNLDSFPQFDEIAARQWGFIA